MQPRWTESEEIKFIRGIIKGKSFDELSIAHSRTSTALELRLKKIIYENITRGKTASKLAEMLKIKKERIRQYYYAYMDFLEKKGDKIVPVNLDTPVDNSENKPKIKQGNKEKDKIKSNLNIKLKSKSKSKSKSNIKPSEADMSLFDKLTMIKQNKLMKYTFRNEEIRTVLKKLYKARKTDDKTKSIIKKLYKYGLF